MSFSLSKFSLFLYSYAVPALMSLDVAGILLRWRKFDHFVSNSLTLYALEYI